MPGYGHQKVYTWEEIKQHTSLTDRWIVIDGVAYNITEWQKKHPGGARILGHFAGKDASEPFVVMHKDRALARKYLKPFAVGTVCPVSDKLKNTKKDLIKDYHEMREHLESIGCFKPSVCFYGLYFIHIILLEVIAYVVLIQFQLSCLTYLLSGFLIAAAQAQAGWLQHDMGHASVFSTSRLNQWGQFIVLDIFKGASSRWWNYRHNQHHARTNIVDKDPDISIPKLFLLGTKLPVLWGQKKLRGYFPHNWQQVYFWLFGPPFLLTIYFLYENLYFLFRRRNLLGVVFPLAFSGRLYLLCVNVLGIWGVLGYYFYIRLVESFWFMICTQINHITMEVDDDDDDLDWITLNAITTCNVERSFFNDWFTGHLNFQIEHHLFPQMPRHNLYKAQPYVRALFQKHDLVYVEKNLSDGILDIYRCLKKSGRLWHDAYKKAVQE